MEIKTLIKIFEPSSVIKIICILPGISLILLGEIFFIEFLSGFWGVYFTLAIVALTGLIGLLAGYREIVTRIDLIKHQVANGRYVDKDFHQLAGAFFSTILLITPGFLTTFLGILGFFPIVKTLYGKFIFKIMTNQPEELYESMNLYN